jgi:hypothetical protein
LVPGVELTGTAGFQMGLRSPAGLLGRHARAGLELHYTPRHWLRLSAGAEASVLWFDSDTALTPQRRLSAAPAVSLSPQAVIPLGWATLGVGPVLHVYARERIATLDGVPLGRLPAQTLALTIDLLWGLAVTAPSEPFD